MSEPRVDAGGTGHVFGAPTGDFMGLTCFSNGSLARERVRDRYGLTWERVLARARRDAAGQRRRADAAVVRAGDHAAGGRRPASTASASTSDDAPANVRAVVEAQLMALALHSRWMGVAVDVDPRDRRRRGQPARSCR